MANKNINVLLKLQDQFSKPLKATTQETKLAQKQIKACSNVINGWANNANKKFKNVAKSVTRAVGVMATLGGAISIAGIKNWSEQSIELAKKQVEAETKLESALKNVQSVAEGGTEAIKKAKKELLETASAIQKVGVVGDEVTIAGMQQLTTYGLSTDAISMLSGSMDDLLVKLYGLNATQENAVTIATAMGKAINGSTGTLARYGIVLTDAEKKMLSTGDATQRAAALNDILQKRVAGTNEAMAQTDQGKIQQAANLYGDMQEEVGKGLLSIKAQFAALGAEAIPIIQDKLLGAVQKLKEKVQAGIEYVNSHREEIKAGISKVAENVSKAFKVVSKAIGWIIDHGNVLIPILAGIVGGFAAFNIITSIVGIISTLTTVIQGVSAAGGILNAVMAANPIILVAAAIAALITIGVALYKNWDNIKAKAVELWDKVKAVFGGIKNAICNAFTAAKDTVKGVIDWIGEKLGWLGEKIEGIPVLGDIFKGVKAVGGAIVGAVTGNRKVDSNATGTSYFRGGATSINEGGRGEVVDLPSGTRIIPHDVAQKTIGGAPVVNVNLQVMGNVIGNQQFMEQCGDFVAKKVISALGTV